MLSSSSSMVKRRNRRTNTPSPPGGPRASPTRGTRGLNLMKGVLLRSFSFSSTGGSSLRSVVSSAAAAPTRDSTKPSASSTTPPFGRCKTTPPDGRCNHDDDDDEEKEKKERTTTRRLPLCRSRSLAAGNIPRRTLRKNWNRLSPRRRCSGETSTIPNKPPKTSHLRIVKTAEADHHDADQKKKIKEQRRKRSLSRSRHSRHSLPKTLQAKLENKETMAYIRFSVKECVQSSSFLLRHQQEEEEGITTSTPVPVLQLQDIQIGDLLGKGAFSNVYQVSGIDDHRPQQSGGQECESSDLSDISSSTNSPPQAPPSLQQELTSSTGKYAIKIPKHPEEAGLGSRAASMLRVAVHRSRHGHGAAKNPTTTTTEEDTKIQTYTRACIDLILEGKYLAAMDHPNIIKIRGFGAADPQASPFLVMDRLHDTLDKRIDQWRKSSSQPQQQVHASSAVQLMSSSSGNHYCSSRRRTPPQRWKSMGNSFRVHSFRKRRESTTPSMCASSSSSITSLSSTSFCSEELTMGSSSRSSGTTRTATTNAMNLLEEKAGFALQIAQALQYMHKHRIILRDLKPNNVGFVRTSGEEDEGRDVVQLFDFGLCRELPQGRGVAAADDEEERGGDEEDRKEEDQEFHMSIAGTTRYMAPEIINTGAYGLKADIYSWGILCYEMLTLERPYAAICRSPEMHRRFVCRDGVRPIFPSHNQCLRDAATQYVPLTVQKLIQTSWAQDKKDRPSASVVCSKLQSLLKNEFNTPTTLSVTATNLNDSSSITPALPTMGTTEASASPPPPETPATEATSAETRSPSEPLPTRAKEDKPPLNRSLSGQDLLNLLTDPDFEANLEAALALHHNDDSLFSDDHRGDAPASDDDTENKHTPKIPQHHQPPQPFPLVESISTEPRNIYPCTA